MPHLVDAAHRQRQVTQHAELSPSGQLQLLFQIGVDDGVVIGVVPVAVDVKEVEPAVFVPRHVHRADDEVQRRRTLHQPCGAVEAQIGLAQFRAQLQLNALAVLRHRVGVLLLGLYPVEAVRSQLGSAPLDGIHMVGEAQLIQPTGDPFPRQLRHGHMAVRRAGGMYMIISQIHQRFLPKKLLRFS